MIDLFCLSLQNSSFAKEGSYHHRSRRYSGNFRLEDESLRRNMVVPYGVILFPLVGDIDVTNLTKLRAEKRIHNELSEYVPELRNGYAVEITPESLLIGKVNRPD
jgi:protein involved in polysaccharide export with SLBB domain